MSVTKETWGPRNETITLDTTGQYQNSNSTIGAQALIIASDGVGITNVGGQANYAGIAPTVIWKNPA